MYLNWIKKIKSKKSFKHYFKKFKYSIFNLINKLYTKNINLIINTAIYFKLKFIKYIIHFYIFKKLYLKKKNKIKKFKLTRYSYKFKHTFKNKYKNKIKKIKQHRYKIKLKYKKWNVYMTKNISSIYLNKKKKINNLLFFLKYFLIFRKRGDKLHYLAKVKSRLSKKFNFLKKNKKKLLSKYFFKKFKYLSLNKKRHILLANMNVLFDQKFRYKRLDRLYDIKKKYLRYLSTNRSIYKLYKFKTKNNFKFIKRHIRSVSNLNLKDRVHMHEYSIRNIIIKLKYAFTFRNSNNLIKSGFVFLNGLQTLNSKFFLFKSDCLELIYSKFVLNLKKKIKRKMYISMRRYKKYNWKMLKNKVEFSIRKVRIFRFVEKILHFKNKVSNVFQFDFRTLSFFLVKELNIKKNISYLNKKLLPLYLMKLLNWKVIT